jgi:hypothetical protein
MLNIQLTQLAPAVVIFFNQAWMDIGTKRSLVELVSEITGIQDLFDWSNASVAQRMSWASGRTATRVEDMAYCLLGLFDVHLPPLYGEGSKAFLRLQLEILRTSDDESLFAWREYVPYGTTSGMLATSVTAFQASGHIQQLNHPKAWTKVRDGYSPPSPYQMTNQGLYMDVIMKTPPERMPPYLENTKIAVIRCTAAASELKETAIAIFLHQIGPDQYMRINPHRLASLLVPDPDWWLPHPEPLCMSDKSTSILADISPRRHLMPISACTISRHGCLRLKRHSLGAIPANMLCGLWAMALFFRTLDHNSR